ncbi:chromate resistance protein [Chitiniphilus purpureus]|uniref:Chromate resistance protein n=1 Tax=Chitiniphilus purpureus TaxID=2981137 RepID=A0ABY6DRB2_9NEIS|nr:chromate resistance protein [Chitiniphilus sp. CD1]UXY16915.1 chromate resistance protein [Chitiniphilus sp. CD1]
MERWLCLILTLPTQNATARMRAYRALKAAGAATLRDGVNLLPLRPACQATLAAIADDIRAHGGTARILEVSGEETLIFPALFERTDEFAELTAQITPLHAALSFDTAAETLKQVRRLRRAFAAMAAIDFFPGLPQRQAEAALLALERAANRYLAPDEPEATAGEPPRLDPAGFQGRVWATRRRPWVDRLASAWLIRRMIDPAAQLLWLASPADCPDEALGFDFDGARFTHVGDRVTFEVLLASFGLETPALQRLAAVVHFLDVGGIAPAEASGVARILAGLRATLSDDDALSDAACNVFDALLAAYLTDSQRPT